MNIISYMQVRGWELAKMGTEAPDSGKTVISKENKDQNAPPTKLDAGDLFVLKSRGNL